MTDYLTNGLSEQQVAISRKKHGSNALTHKKRQGFFRQYLSNFGDPIIKVLLVALGINILFLFRNHDWYESAGIAVAVFLATFVSTLSEYGSESAFEKLQEEAGRIFCRVRRDGRLCSVALDEIVVGDIVLLQSGERIPADGILIEGDVRVDQSALNGESEEAEKYADHTAKDLDLSGTSALFRGSVICAGNGIMRVARVGNETVYGQIADELQDETRESPLKLRLAGLAKTLSRIGFVAAGLVGLADLFHSLVIQNGYSLPAITASFSDIGSLVGSILHAVTLAITVVVVAVPEGLPMMITVVLSSNMRRMLKDQVLVRKLVGIETSGSITMLFTDKTGTLTEGKPKVSTFVDAEGNSYTSVASLRRQKALWQYVQLSCLYNTESQLSGGEILGGNATDRALLQYICDRHPLHINHSIQQQIPFSSDRKWSAVEIAGTGTAAPCSLYKGATERLLPSCDRYLAPDGSIRPLIDDVNGIRFELEKNAMRMLLLAIDDHTLSDTPSHLILIGFVGLRDDVRPEVRKAVSAVRKAGIQVVMMTGDSKETSTAIARSAGLFRSASEETQSVITGNELTTMSDTQIKERLSSLSVIARALPGDKSRLIRLAQECGYVVGMTGDGVNDAPALKKADVGFAMGSGTEVAKQAGDIVILDNNFASIAKAVLYGRTIFKSIRKFIIFQLTMNLCAVGISIIGPFIGVDTPVTVMQMLWINMIMDTLAGLAFAGEPPLKEYMEESPKRRDEPILNRYMLNQILCTGGFTVALCVAFLRLDFSKLLFRYDIQPIYWMTAFFALFIFCGIFNSFNARTTRLNLLSHLRKNPSFVIIMTAVMAIQITLIYYGGTLFRTAGLTPRELFVILSLAALVIPFDMLRKSIIRLLHRHGTV